MFKSFPTPLTVIFIVILVCALATWLVPAGQYSTLAYDNNTFLITDPSGKVSGIAASQNVLDSLSVPIQLEKFTNNEITRAVTIPGTYIPTGRNPRGLIAIIQAPLKGIYDTVDIILFVLMIGGFIRVFNETGILEKGTRLLTERFRGREKWLIIILSLLMAAGGTTFGLAEETITFYPILVPVLVAAGYDLLVPLAVIFVGAHIGNMAATINPFSVIIASNAAGVNWTTGLTLRLIMLASAMVVSLVYIIRYAERVRKNPKTSLVHRLEPEVKNHFELIETGTTKIDLRSKLMLVVFGLTFVMLVFGVVRLHWWMTEMSALFLGSAIVSAFLLRMSEKKFVKSFVEGAAELIGVAMVIGFARGVTIILQEGNIIDTILFHLTDMVSGVPHGIFVIGLLVVFFVLALLISSTSGLAVVTMPIIGALAIAIGVSGDTVVNAYLFGAGLMYLISPTELILPSLAMVNLNYNTWIRFVTPLMGWLFLLSCVMLLLDLWVI